MNNNIKILKNNMNNKNQIKKIRFKLNYNNKNRNNNLKFSSNNKKVIF